MNNDKIPSAPATGSPNCTRGRQDASSETRSASLGTFADVVDKQQAVYDTLIAAAKSAHDAGDMEQMQLYIEALTASAIAFDRSHPQKLASRVLNKPGSDK